MSIKINRILMNVAFVALILYVWSCFVSATFNNKYAQSPLLRILQDFSLALYRPQTYNSVSFDISCPVRLSD